MNKIELPRIVGISGRKNSGKDLVGEILQRLTVSNDITFNYRWDTDNSLYLRNEDLPEYDIFSQPNPTHDIKKFADKIKDIVGLLIGCSREDLENREFKNKELGKEWDGMTARKLLQILGTEAGRNIINNDIWVNALFSDYHNGEIEPFQDVEIVKEFSQWIITDVRFENEVQAIKDRGGIVIRVNRESDLVDNHPSETSLDNYNFDYVIDNNKDIEHLIEEVKKLNITNLI